MPKKPIKRALVKVEPAPPPSILAIIANAAANPSVDVSKMRELLTMQREIMAEEARIAFTEAFIKMTFPRIDRDGKIDEGTTRSGRVGKKTRYASFENINASIAPELERHGFALWFEPDIGSDGKIVVRGHLDHIRGHGKVCAIAMPPEVSGNKNTAQAIGSSLSYMKRFATIALLNIISHAPEDRDLDGGAPTVQPKLDVAINDEQLEQLNKAIADCGVPISVVLKKYGIQTLDKMLAVSFQDALDACARFKAATPTKAT